MNLALPFDGLAQAVTALHWLRPQWLWALLALPLLVALWQYRRKRTSVWRTAVDAHLLPHLLDGRVQARGYASLWLGLIAYMLAVLALAGPSWRQIEQPLWQSRTPLVIALDLSSSSLAGDLPPTRLAQARAKIATLLAERQGGQVGLVVFAEDAFTVAPLTEDAQNVALFLDALQPDIMPVDGQRADRAIAWSARLLRQAGFDSGQILILTDHAAAPALDTAATAAAQGYVVSALGLGSGAGASFRLRTGNIEQARLDAGSLADLAARGGGRYVALTPDSSDLHALDVLDPAAGPADMAQDGQGRSWQDEGYWLLLPLMLLALFAFRRSGASAAAAVLAICVWLPAAPVHAQAATSPSPSPRAAAASENLWQRPDQAAHRRLRQGTEAYRSGEYQRAAELYREVTSADGQYNLGNALAKEGRYAQAIEAYDRALAREPGMADALANKRAVEEAMKRQPPQGPRDDPRGQPDEGEDGDRDPQPGQNQPGSPSSQGQPSPEAEGGEPDEPAPPPAGSPADSTDSGEAAPADAQAQQAADAAQREAMQRALEQQQQAADAEPAAPTRAPETPAERERRLANEAWLQRVPDDPGGLLREKFRIEHERRRMQGGSGE